MALLSWIVFGILIFTLNSGLRSSDFSKSFWESLEPATKAIPLFIGGICVLWLILISRILEKLKNTVYQWLLILLPIFILGAWAFRKLPTPQNQFSQITGVELPSEIQNLKSEHVEILFSRKRHTFSFHCSPTETTRLIDDLGWSGPSLWIHDRSWIQKRASPPPHDLDIDSWTEPKVYRVPSKGGWNFVLVTDKQREQLFIELVRW